MVGTTLAINPPLLIDCFGEFFHFLSDLIVYPLCLFWWETVGILDVPYLYSTSTVWADFENNAFVDWIHGYDKIVLVESFSFYTFRYS
jgi:hypothetical protein